MKTEKKRVCLAIELESIDNETISLTPYEWEEVEQIGYRGISIKDGHIFYRLQEELSRRVDIIDYISKITVEDVEDNLENSPF